MVTTGTQGSLHGTWLRAAALLCAAGVLLLGSQAAGAAVTHLRIAHRWGVDNPFQWGLDNAVDAFEARHPDMQVDIRGGYNTDRYLVEIAGGTPPDVIFVAGPNLIAQGLSGLLQPLTEYVERSGVSPEDFMPTAWSHVSWQGEVYAMPLQVDPNFSVIWNKGMFSEVGLDPERGPATLADVEAFSDRLTRFDAEGRRVIGFIPWSAYTWGNAVYTWGFIFGGRFYDPINQRVTADDPRIVEALEYLQDAYVRLGQGERLLRQGLPAGRNTFSGGRLAMQFAVTGTLFHYLQNFPDLSIGITGMFNRPESGVENPAWLGGWSIAMPSGVQHPDAAWQLIHFLTADPEGTSRFAEASGWMPFFIESPVYRNRYLQDPYVRVYVDIALTAQGQRPAVPIIDFYYQQLNAVAPEVVTRGRSAREALEEVTRLTQLELEAFLEQQ